MGGFGSGRWRAHTPKTYVEDCRVLRTGGVSALTKPHFGGNRTWHVCPLCGSRVGKLFMPPGQSRWGCRKCHNLAYASQRQAVVSRSIRSAQKIREKLAGSINLFTPFPERPKGMHWQTYLRLRIAGSQRMSALAGAHSQWKEQTLARLSRSKRTR
jgi:hypothetical protein